MLNFRRSKLATSQPNSHYKKGARLDLLLGSSENLAKVKVMWGMDVRPLKWFLGRFFRTFSSISHFTKISQCLEKTSKICFFAFVFVSSTLFCALDNILRNQLKVHRWIVCA